MLFIRLDITGYDSWRLAYILWFNRPPLELPPASIPSALSTVRFGEASFELFCRFFCSPETLRQSAPSRLDPASLRLEVVIWERFGTVDKNAIHLAQVSQVDGVHGHPARVPESWRRSNS
jgi:hypothetical protein